jgi:hypothetical protein
MVEKPWAKDFRRYIPQWVIRTAFDVTCSQATSKNAEKDNA